MERKVIYFGDYFKDFIGSLDKDVREKIDYVLDMLKRVKRIGANKSYISRIENGLIDPTISTIYSIINALGLRIEIVKPIE